MLEIKKGNQHNKQHKKQGTVSIKRKTAILIFWLLVWQVISMLVNNWLLLVGPVRVAEALLVRVGDSRFWITVFCSMLRVAIGFLGGFILGALLGAISARYPVIEELLKPVMTLFQAIPVASFVVLFLIWWGASFLSTAVSFLIVLPNIYINTLEGMKSADRKLLEMAKVFRMSFVSRFFYIYVPALKPFLDGGLRFSLGMSWKSGTAAEVIGMPDFSIGEQLYRSKISLDNAGVLAWTAVVILLSSCFEKAFLALFEKIAEWRPYTAPHTKSANSSKCVKSSKSAKSSESVKSPKCEQIRPLKLEAVEFGYDEKKILHGYQGCFLPGKIYYFKTPSGTGKTTLLRLLAGLERAEGGTICGLGRCSMVFQEDRLIEDVSPMKNVELSAADREEALKSLALLLPDADLLKPCNTLSGGMKRRVALVRAMEAEGDYVLLDEPFTGLDAANKQAAADYIKRSQRGRTLLIATHKQENLL